MKNRPIILFFLMGILCTYACGLGIPQLPSESGDGTQQPGGADNNPAENAKGAVNNEATWPPIPTNPNGSQLEFDLNKENKTAPDYIMQEIYSGGKGGGGDAGPCEDQYMNLIAYAKPTIFSDPDDSYLMETATMITCGWRKNIMLTGKIIDPKGKTHTQQIHSYNGQIDLSFKPFIDDPVGYYVFEISDGDTVLQSNVYFREPVVAMLYKLNDQQVMFYKFVTGEKVKLVMYESYGMGGRFLGLKEFTITGKKFVVNVTPVKNSLFFAIDSKGYEIADRYDEYLRTAYRANYPELGSEDISELNKALHKLNDEIDAKRYAQRIAYKACPPNLQTPLTRHGGINGWARTTSSVNLYSQPRSSSRVVAKISNDQIFSVEEGPICFEKAIWWRVALSDNHTGAEFQTGYITEINANKQTYLEPTDETKTFCAGVPSSYIWMGANGRITFTGGSRTNLRSAPTTAGAMITKLPEGTIFNVIDGPKCSGGYTWWQIHLTDGRQGWLAENDGYDYFIEPVSQATQVCEDPVSRLKIGMPARVAHVNGIPSNIRARPGFSQEVIGTVPEGTKLTAILKGPKCVDGTNWWYVSISNHTLGWMTETQQDDYLLEPLP